MEKTAVIIWPWVRIFMDKEGFRQNAAQYSSAELYGIYGDSAYAVRQERNESPDTGDPGIRRTLRLGCMGHDPDTDFSRVPEEGVLCV